MSAPDLVRVNELHRVFDEKTPNNVADWTVKDRPRARELLESIKGK